MSLRGQNYCTLFLLIYIKHANAHQINMFAEEMKFGEQTTSQTLHLNNLKEITIQRKLNYFREQNFQQAASRLHVVK